MANVLNLALKKDVYEGLINKTTNEIPIDKSDWWTKRLMDQDTGRFKEFDVVSASCGSAVKIEYPIVSIEDKGSRYIITVAIEEAKEPVVEETPVIEDAEPITEDPVEESPVIEEKEVNDETPEVQQKGIKEKVLELLNEFCSNPKVYNVNTSTVIIRRNGQIMGTNKYLNLKDDCENIIQLGYESFIKYKELSDEDYLNIIRVKFEQFLNGNYAFIRKGACGFTRIVSGEMMFVMRIATRKTYLFK